MITKPYVVSTQQSAGDVVNCVGETSDELSVNCTSLFIYDNVERHSNYYDCVGDDNARPTELLYPASQHSSQLHHVPQQQQQQCEDDGDEDAAMELQLLAGCSSKAALEFPWMRDKKSASDTVCLSTSMSERQLKHCLTSDPLIQTTGLTIFVGTDYSNSAVQQNTCTPTSNAISYT